MSRARTSLGLLVLLAATAAIYGVSLHGPFVYDDIQQFYDNARLHDIFRLRDVVFCGLRETRPVMNALFAACWTFAPGQAWPFRLVLLAAHLMNGALAFALLRRHFGAAAAWMATALFLLHPLQTQGVAYLSGGVSALQCFFYLACLTIHDRGWKPGWILALLPVAILTKETCALIPLALVAHDLTLGGKSSSAVRWKRHLGFASAALVPGALYFLLVRNPLAVHAGMAGFGLFPYGEYLLVEFGSYLFHLRLLADVSAQSLIHPYPAFDRGVLLRGLIGGAACASCLVAAWRRRARAPRFAFFVAFYFIALLPTNGFIEVVNPFAEYRLYQADLALFVAIAWGLERLCGLLARAPARMAIRAALLTWTAWNCFLMQRVWSSEPAIYVHSLGSYPDSPELTQLLGGYFEDSGRLDLAEEQYRKSEELLARHPIPLPIHPSTLLAQLYVKSGDEAKLLGELERMNADPAIARLDASFYREELRLLRAKGLRERFEAIRLRAGAENRGQLLPAWDEATPPGTKTESPERARAPSPRR